MAVTGAELGLPEDLDAVVAAAERYFRAQLPEHWVAAVDHDDLEGLVAARRSVDPDVVWGAIAAGGYLVPSWEIEYGGLGASPAAAAAISRTLGHYRMPTFRNPVGVDLVGPALMRWGNEKQKASYLPAIARHQEIWCQLFSEPGSGSDLAGLATRAVADGDTWVLNGQKVWTSLGDVATFGILLARTDPEAPKHRGISTFILPMAAQGVMVRPLRQTNRGRRVLRGVPRRRHHRRLVTSRAGRRRMAGRHLGAHERAQGGLRQRGGAPRNGDGPLDQCADQAARTGDRSRCCANDWLRPTSRIVSSRSRTSGRRRGDGPARPPGPEGSVSKLFFSEHTQRVQTLALDLEGPHGQAWPEGDRWLQGTAWSFLRVRSKTIAGGTSEIQRNILGERILGLPKESEVDRDVPWSQVRRS